MPKVSVIMPVYNVENYVEPSMRSLLDQTEPDIEIIAVNDGSTDGSLEVLRRLAGVDDRIKVIDQKNAGPSAARNTGMAIATAPIIAFLDADDFFKPRACRAHCRALRRTRGRWHRRAHLRGRLLSEGVFDSLARGQAPSARRRVRSLRPGPAVQGELASLPLRTAVRTGFLRESGIAFDESLRLGRTRRSISRSIPGQSGRCSFPTSSTNTG